ncbi:MAG TPA: amidohydrolase family protein [Pyrinomonadaceae bacterium]|jgi:imidazolonepropionase-like amidohydrolase|nr:amidohydrolase family protein [Pyrinomonadaceae bacterium]
MSTKWKVDRAKFFALITLAIATLFSNTVAQNDGTEQNAIGRAGTFAIVGARIVTVSGATIENGTVVIQNGKIAAVGAAVSVPAGAERIDGKGLSVYPGMIDAGTNMGLAEITLAVPGSVDLTEVAVNNASAMAIKGIHPDSAHINVTRINGITTVMSIPGGGVIGGRSAVINLNGATPDEMAVTPVYGLVVNFPRIALGGGFGGGFGGGGQPVDFNEAVKRRDSAVDDLKKMFRNADNYARAREAYEKDKTLAYPPNDPRLEAMIPYLRGEKPVIFAAERERDIKAVAKFVGEMKLKGIILGGQDAWKAAEDLKKNNISVIYTNIYALPVQDDDPYDYLFEAPSKMAAAGVKFCISTGDTGPEVRDLPYHAGLAGAFGLSYDDAVKAVTLYPAEILGVADKMGSIDVGKMANIVVADGSILEPRTNIKYEFIGGRLIPLTSRHTRLFDAFKDRKMPQ